VYILNGIEGAHEQNFVVKADRQLREGGIYVRGGGRYTQHFTV